MAIITISRGTMSGGKKLAQMLADRLGYKCISREVIIKAATDYDIEENKLFEAIRNSPSISITGPMSLSTTAPIVDGWAAAITIATRREKPTTPNIGEIPRKKARPRSGSMRTG